MKRILFCLLIIITSIFSSTAQETNCNLQKGFNLGGWFEKDSAKQIVNSQTITVLENLIALGADHFRLPIDLFKFTGNSPTE